MKRELPSFCGKDCGGNACPLMAVVEDYRVLGMKDNPAAGPDLKPCPRGYALHRASYAGDRLLEPLISDGARGSGRFRKASWDEALDLVSKRLSDIRARHGASSVLAMGGWGGNGALHNTGRLLSRFLNAARPAGSEGPSDSATFLSGSYSNGAAKFVLPYLFGTSVSRSGFDASTVDSARLIILWGANPLEARLGAELGYRLEEAARSGVPVLVIDPRKTVTATRLGARWIPIRPGTDAALMLAILHEFYASGRVDRRRVASLAVGMDELAAYVQGGIDGIVRDPRWAQSVTGVPAGLTSEIAGLWLDARTAMLVPGYSIQRVRAGEESYRLSVALQLACGSFGLEGGSTGSMNNLQPGPKFGTLPDLKRGDEISVPVARWPDAVLGGRAEGFPSDIRAAYIAGCNYVNQGADIRKNLRAMRGLEFSVCHEMFLTPSALQCDVVLPASSPLEKEDVGIPWAGQYVLYKPRATAHEGLARDDYAIFSELADRMGFGWRFHEGRTAGDWLRSFLSDSGIEDIEAFKSNGIYRAPDARRPGLESFVLDPEANPLDTPSGKVEIRSERYAGDTGASALPLWNEGAPVRGHRFLLVTPKTVRRTHSQNGGGRSWTGSRADFGELAINDRDAASLGVATGDLVLVSNRNGSLSARALATPDIAPDVVSLHEGVWFELDGNGVDAAGSANMVTSTDVTGPSSGAVMHGIPVSMRRLGRGPAGKATHSPSPDDV